MSLEPNFTIVQRVDGVELLNLQLSPQEAFVWSCIETAIEFTELRDITGLPESDLLSTLARLRTLGLVQSKMSSPPPATTLIPSDARELPLPKEDALGNEADLEIDPERRAQVSAMHATLDASTFYELLSVPPDADRAAIRKAYFELSKAFHPDTLFRKNIGSYKAKMETIFKRITEAYDVLSKKDSRAEYDGYLQVRNQTLAMQSSLLTTPPTAESLRPQKISTPTPRSEPRTIPSTPSHSPAAPVVRGVSQRRAADAIFRSLGRTATPAPAARTISTIPVVRSVPAPPKSSASITPPSRGTIPPSGVRDALVKELAQTLKQVSTFTGGVDKIERQLQTAREAEAQQDWIAAANALRLAKDAAPDRLDIAADYDRVRGIVSATLAEGYEKQAEYEENHQLWSAAALSWVKVCEGKPDYAFAYRKVAEMLLAAKGDVHHAQQYAQKSMLLEPDDAKNHLVLGQTLLAAGLKKNAKRELETALKLEPHNETAKKLLLEVK